MRAGPPIADIAANVATAVAVLVLCSVIAWHITTPETMPATAPLAAQTSNPAPMSDLGTRDHTAIADWQLFGAAAPATEEPSEFEQGVAVIESMDALPESSVRLEVTGTVAASVADSARAIILDSSGQQREYRIGDRLPGNIELHAVEPTRIVIRRNGVLEAIALPQPNELLPNRRPQPTSNTDHTPRSHDNNLVAHDDL